VRIPNPVGHAVLTGVFALRVDIRVANGDGAEFIASDSAVEDFLAAGGDIEKPFTILVLRGAWEGPEILADFQQLL